MTDYATCTVARATVRDVPEVLVMKAVRGWHLGHGVPGFPGTWQDEASDEDVTNIRPLVLLDLDFPLVLRLLKEIRDTIDPIDDLSGLQGVVKTLVREIEQQTRKFTKEPVNIGAIVLDQEGASWVRVSNARAGVPVWVCASRVMPLHWDQLDVVEVISEGVPDDLH